MELHVTDINNVDELQKDETKGFIILMHRWLHAYFKIKYFNAIYSILWLFCSPLGQRKFGMLSPCSPRPQIDFPTIELWCPKIVGGQTIKSHIVWLQSKE